MISNDTFIVTHIAYPDKSKKCNSSNRKSYIRDVIPSLSSVKKVDSSINKTLNYMSPD